MINWRGLSAWPGLGLGEAVESWEALDIERHAGGGKRATIPVRSTRCSGRVGARDAFTNPFVRSTQAGMREGDAPETGV